jgi:hypothetical protein
MLCSSISLLWLLSFQSVVTAEESGSLQGMHMGYCSQVSRIDSSIGVKAIERPLLKEERALCPQSTGKNG